MISTYGVVLHRTPRRRLPVPAANGFPPRRPPWFAARVMTAQPPLRAVPGAVEPQENRLLAAVAHLACFAGFWFVGPIALYVLKRRESRFVAFHALQAVLVQALFGLVMTVGFVGFLVLFALVGSGKHDGLAAATFALPLGGLALGVLGLVAVHLLAAFRAWRGEGWSIPLVGRIAMAILGADEGAAKT